MILENLSLARQVDMVFREIKNELLLLTSGTVFIQIRSNIVGKFGVRHDPLECKGGVIREVRKGLSEEQFASFRQMAIEALKHKKNWTHGEIYFEFAVKQNVLHASINLESNYNMAQVVMRMNHHSHDE
ncbi:O-methyltransferase [Ferviditalea candida]|uniref:O-methyltransferase n=1 Tax=Ferviditalea candida TaxID=3108399 RepID=A0ABU5ZCW8_9BACL|nr:O-methyltransferase [Paenibacillaceae bacterium T2]